MKSEVWIGKKQSVTRTLVCAMQGQFPIALKQGENRCSAIFRVGAQHIGLQGTVALSESHDRGQTWTTPVDLFERGMDFRNPAFGENHRGQRLVAAWAAGKQVYKQNEEGWTWDTSQKEKWDQAAICILNLEEKTQTWIQSDLIHLAQPFGKMVKLPQDKIAMCIYGNPKQNPDGAVSGSSIVISEDGGKTWPHQYWIGYGFNESALLYHPGENRLYSASRSDRGGTFLLFSDDLGQTWSTAKPLTSAPDHPADLCLSRGGNIILSYGKRRRPLGCGAARLTKNHEVLDPHILLAGDGIQNWDCGYPSTITFDDGGLVTILYFASGSQMSEPFDGWGEVSCQAIHWHENLFTV